MIGWQLWNRNRVNRTGWVLTCIGPMTWKPQYLLRVETGRQCMSLRCTSSPVYALAWPGQPLKFACVACAERAQAVAEAMGFYLPLQPLIPIVEA